MQRNPECGTWNDVARWGHYMRQRYPGVAVSLTEPTQRFCTSFRCWSLEGIEFAEIHTQAGQELAVRQPCARAQSAWYLPLQLRGEYLAGQENREFRADAGSMLLLDSHSPHWRMLAPGSHLLNVRIPKGLLGQFHCDPHGNCAKPICADAGHARIAWDFILSLWQRRSEIAPENRAGLADALVRLVANLAGCERASVSTLQGIRRRDVRMIRLLDFIQGHLADPRLDVAFAADSCGMSVRYVHKLMHDAGNRFSHYVRERRLELSRTALKRDRDAKRSVTEIALDCGFTDPSHFSSAFRHRYGISPRAWRQLRDS